MNVSPYKNYIQNINDVFHTIRFQCRENKEIDYSMCQNMLEPLNSLYNDIARDFDSISHIISNSVSKRSAWFAGVGVVFKHIFGTMDEDDAENYNKAIQNLYNNDKIIANSIRKNIIVSQIAILNINQSLHEIEINEAKINDAIYRMSNKIYNISQMVKINNVFNVLQSNLLTLSFKIEDILNSILFLKSNVLHPSILTPNQLYQDIVSNLKIIPKYRDFPVSLEISNIHILLNIASLVCYYVDNKLVYVIKLPLVSVLEYNLYKTIPLPTSHVTDSSNSFVMILPSEEYIAVSKDKSSFTYLKSLNPCKNVITTQTYLCESTDVYTIPGNPSCEIEIITKSVTTLPESCRYKIIHGDIDIWHKLHNEKFIFVQSKPSKLTIECNNNDVTELVISGTGVLSIPTKCIGYHKNFKLVRKASPKINVPSIVSTFNILNDSCCNLSQIKKHILPMSKIQNVNLDSLKTINIASDKIIKELDLVQYPGDWNNHISFPILSVLAFILCLSTLIFYVCKKNEYLKRLCRINKLTITKEENSETEIEIEQPRLRMG